MIDQQRQESAAAMDDVWFGHDATPAEYEACVGAFSVAQDQAPLFAITVGEGAARLLFASRSLFRVFDVSTGDALERRLLVGTDPGAKRLRILVRDLPSGDAPRLERLRFLQGPGTEVLTLLCGRIAGTNRDLFVAAIANTAVGSPPGYAGRATIFPAKVVEPIDIRQGEPSPAGMSAPMSVQAIQATLRSRWPTSRTLRFTWQTDASQICTQITPALAEIVGPANADLVGHDMKKLAAVIDPTGRFEHALASRETWSGLQVHWPIADASAAVVVGLGAIPMFDREGGFEGFRGYGVVDRETAVAAKPVYLGSRSEEASGRVNRAANLVSFPNGKKELSAEDQQAFVTLGEELREEAGLDDLDATPNQTEAISIQALNVPFESVSQGDPALRDVSSGGLAICNKLPIGILVSRDNIPIFANRHLLDRLGFRDEDELHEAGGLDHLFKNQPDRSMSNEPACIRGRDGRVVPGQARVQSVEWEGLPATLLTLSHQEVALPEGQDTELHELRAILETATDGVAVIDQDYSVLSLNRSGEALFGCDRGQVIGRPFLTLFAADNRELVRSYLEGLKSNVTKQLLNDGREFVVDIHPRGTIPVFMTLGRLPGRSTSQPGDGPRFCALFRDLTHWKKVERDLESAKLNAESANDRKSDFLAKISHEIRTPLNAIIGFAEVMMDERLGPIGSERYKDYLRDIHSSGTHVMSLVNDLLDLSKIEAGKMDLAIEVIDVNKVIGECVAIMQPQASNSRVILRLSLSSTLPRIKADERSLRQIVLNILSNAVKFNEPGGQVIVATTLTETGHAVIRIRDTGPGMSDIDITAALEPFRQLPTARATTGGTGLGLPLTKALVEANQATFTIRSKIQQGTLVEVAFPPARILAA